MKLKHSLILYTKINSKWIKDLNVRLDTTKLLEEKKQNMFFHKSQQYFFGGGGPSPKVKAIKVKISKWDPIKLESFCTAK